jgi:hydrogenase/urease accessory protein HupE
MFRVVLLLSALFMVALAHPERRVRSTGLLNCSDYPPIMSYHTHIVFMVSIGVALYLFANTV